MHEKPYPSVPIFILHNNCKNPIISIQANSCLQYTMKEILKKSVIQSNKSSITISKTMAHGN